MSTFILPSDVTDNITDHLLRDKPTLRALCLVSRQWLLSSQYRLFHTITIAILRDDETPLVEQMRQFIIHLETHIHLAAYVRELRIYGSSENPLEGPTLVSLVATLQSLDTLHLHSCHLQFSSEGEKCHQDTYVIHLRKIILEYVCWVPFQFPFGRFSIKSLQMLDCTPNIGAETADTTRLQLDSVEALTAEFINLPVWFRCSLHHLTTLNIIVVLDVAKEFNSFKTCLREKRARLAHLRLDVQGASYIPARCNDHDPKASMWRSLELKTSCPSLRTLHITVYTDAAMDDYQASSDDDTIGQWQYAAFLISQAPPSVAEVIIGSCLTTGCFGPYMSVLEHLDWAKLEDALLSCTGLEHVRLQSDKEPIRWPFRTLALAEALPVSWQNFIRTHMPLLQFL